MVDLFVDGSIVYTYAYTSPANMYWTGAGNAVVGTNMDGGGDNIAVLDNLVIQNASETTLPLLLLSFDAQPAGGSAALSWSTTQEVNEKMFEIQHSTDGIHL